MVKNHPLGWLPQLSLVTALGIALISVACAGSRIQASWAQPLFWLGFLAILIPSSVRLCMTGTARGERIGILAIMAFGYYLVKVLYSPSFFTLNDELQHMQSMENILRTHQLFQENRTLQVSAFFPGLENITGALINISGLPVFPAAMIVCGVAFVLIPVVLFLLFEALTHSPYLAGIASLAYFANPSYLLGYAQFSYEVLAIVMAFFVLYLLLIRLHTSSRAEITRLTTLIVLFLSAVIITHHVTSYFLAAVISAWALVAFLRKNSPEQRSVLGAFALLAIAGCAFWMFFTNFSLISGYIIAPLNQAVIQMLRLVMAAGTPRKFFANQGEATSLWLQIPSYLSVILILVSIPLGFLALRRQRHISSLAFVLAGLSLSYLVAQGMRLSTAGLAMTNRIAATIFLPLSFVIAVGAMKLISDYVRTGRRRLALFGWIFLVNLGAATAIIASWQLPGPYNPNIFTRVIGPEAITTAEWTREVLGPNHMFGADYFNTMIFGSYGDQKVVSEENDFYAEPALFQSPGFTPVKQDYLRSHDVEYLVIDTRQANQLVLKPAPGSLAHPTSLDGQPEVSRVIDSGGITIYHMGFVSPDIQVTTTPPDMP